VGAGALTATGHRTAGLRRRDLLLGAACAAPLAACRPPPAPAWEGGWVGGSPALGHRLRDLAAGPLPVPAVQRRAGVLVVGAGVAGLSCARALTRAGIDDVHVFDLEDQAGGNSRAHRMAGMACPLGAHYLPVPDARATDLLGFLEALGLCRTEHGRPVFDERHLCHSPQERLFIDGQWQDGLLPADPPAATLAEYRRFAEVVARAARDVGFGLPTRQVAWTPAHAALDAVTFAGWLDTQGFASPALRTYLDYCCRDDFGAGAAQVSAWAGLHYFASRHGFHAPGTDGPAEREGVFTWPEGNAWLTARLAAPLGDRLHTGMLALRATAGRHDVVLDLWNAPAGRSERWTAPRLVMATPLFVAARLLVSPPPALQAAARLMRYAPWLVANLQLDDPLDDRPGAPPSWDNVIHGSALLGYVDAMHQGTRPHPGPTVLTAYWALGGDSDAQLRAQRARLLGDPWASWAAAVVADLATAHPDLAAKLRRIDLVRYGHAMSIPVPGVRGSAALAALSAPPQAGGRVAFAHSDLSGHSVFEEAFFHGNDAARRVIAGG
jgi:predicted NAD/FAD-dependent oxidoreductase